MGCWPVSIDLSLWTFKHHWIFHWTYAVLLVLCNRLLSQCVSPLIQVVILYSENLRRSIILFSTTLQYFFIFTTACGNNLILIKFGLCGYWWACWFQGNLIELKAHCVVFKIKIFGFSLLLSYIESLSGFDKFVVKNVHSGENIGSFGFNGKINEDLTHL